MKNAKVERYLIEQLAFSGLAVADHQIGLELRPDLWTSAANAYSDWTEARREIQQFLGSLARVSTFEGWLKGRSGPVLIAARDETDLAARVCAITGLEVFEIAPFRPQESAPAAPTVTAPDDEPPAHQCAARAQYFYERGLQDPQLAGRA